MGNVSTSDQHRGNPLIHKRSDNSKHPKEMVHVNEDKATQCRLLIPPSARDLARQNASYAVKMVQVGRKPSLRNRATQTEVEHESSPSCVMRISARRSSPSPMPHDYSNSLPITRRHRHLSSPLFTYRDSSWSYETPYSRAVPPGRSMFALKQPRFDDLSKMSELQSGRVYEAPPMKDLSHYHTNSSPSNVCSGDSAWYASTPHHPFQQPAEQPTFQLNNKVEQMEIVDRIEITHPPPPPPMTDSSKFRCSFRKAMSCDDFYHHPPNDERFYRAQSQQISNSHIFPELSIHKQPYYAPPIYTMQNTFVPDTNQSNQFSPDGAYTSSEYIPVYNEPRNQYYGVPTMGSQMLFASKPSGAMLHPAYSMYNLAHQSNREMSYISRINPTKTKKMKVTEYDSRRLMRSDGLNNGNKCSSASPPTREYTTRQPATIRDTLEKAMVSSVVRNAARSKSVSFEGSCRFRFYLKDTPQVAKVLFDPNDRRIQSICDRFQCDIEVYSKILKSGFLQYAVDLTAPDSTRLYACSRNLDSALGWFLTAQLYSLRFYKR